MNEINEELQQRIAAYIDGALSPAEAARLEVYLANTDPALADMIVGMLSDKSQLRGLPKAQAPGDLEGRIMEQIERESLLREEEPAARRSWWQSRAAMAAGLAIVLGGFTYFVASSVQRPPQDSWTATPKQSGAKLANGEIKSDLQGEASAARRSGAPAMSSGLATKQDESKDKGMVSAMTMPSEVKKEEMTLAAPAAPVIAAAPEMATADELSARQLAAGGGLTAPGRQDFGTGTAGALPEGGVGVDGMGGAAGGGRGGRGGGLAMGGGGAGGGFGGGGMGGGGGGMRGAGGRGGRGGAAPMAAPVTAAPTAAAAPAMSNIVRMVAPTTENTARTLATLTRENQGPMVVTLYAKENGDYAKLANTLVAYAEANVPAVLNTAQEGRVGQLDEARGVARGPATAAPGAAAVSGGSVADRLQTGNIQMGLNSSGVIVVENIAQASENGVRARTVYEQSVGNRIGSEAPASSSGTRFSGGGSTPVADSTFKDQSATASSAPAVANRTTRDAESSQTVQQVAASGGPYHVVLRPEQLEDLARNYRMAVVARGETVVQFQTAGDRAPQTVDAKDRADLLRRSGFDVAQAAARPSSQPKSERDGVSAPAASVGIDCVITMEPSPTPSMNP